MSGPRDDRFVSDEGDIQEEGYLGKDGKVYKELPESERMDYSHLYPASEDDSTKGDSDE